MSRTPLSGDDAVFARGGLRLGELQALHPALPGEGEPLRERVGGREHLDPAGPLDRAARREDGRLPLRERRPGWRSSRASPRIGRGTRARGRSGSRASTNRIFAIFTWARSTRNGASSALGGARPSTPPQSPARRRTPSSRPSPRSQRSASARRGRCGRDHVPPQELAPVEAEARRGQPRRTGGPRPPPRPSGIRRIADGIGEVHEADLHVGERPAHAVEAGEHAPRPPRRQRVERQPPREQQEPGIAATTTARRGTRLVHPPSQGWSPASPEGIGCPGTLRAAAERAYTNKTGERAMRRPRKT